jgi:dephospho-CoA kinase
MIRIGILGDIGSGKSHVASVFGYPVFNADLEVIKIYKSNKKIFYKLKKNFPNHFSKFPIIKSEMINFLTDKKENLKKINKIVHPEVRKKMQFFLRANKKKKIVILDIPLLLENKLNKKSDILIFVEAKKNAILKRIVKRKNFNTKLYKIFKKIQKPLEYKKKKSDYTVKNNFIKLSVKKDVKKILKKIIR